MKRTIPILLCIAILVLSVPVTAGADSIDSMYRNGFFIFESGASIQIPSGFRQNYTERDKDNSRINTYLTHSGQNMDLTVSEIKTYMGSQRDTEYINSLYQSLKKDYPKPTYDDKRSNMFALSGYTGDYIYYFQAFLSNQVIHMVKMFYPTRNRSVCDRYVENIVDSFTASGNSGVSPAGIRIPDSPRSPYGIALRENLVRGVPYTDQQKKDVVTNTYYSRKDAYKKNQPWYTSTYINDSTGYRLGFYYADGLLFFADAYIKGERSCVTFYFWGTQLLCVHDKRNGDKQLRFAGSDTYSAVVKEFEDVYAKGTKR